MDSVMPIAIAPLVSFDITACRNPQIRHLPLPYSYRGDTNAIADTGDFGVNHV
jgi:hypothetical protein